MAWVALKNKTGLTGSKLFTGSWIPGHGAMVVGCRFWRMPPSWLRKDWSEVAEVMAVGRWFQSHGAGKGVEHDRIAGVLLV